MKLAGRTTATLVYKHVALQGRHLGEGCNHGIARDIDKTPIEIMREAMLPDIMKKQSKSLTAKVVTRRCFESRRDRQGHHKRTDPKGRFVCCFMPIFCIDADLVDQELRQNGQWIVSDGQRPPFIDFGKITPETTPTERARSLEENDTKNVGIMSRTFQSGFKRLSNSDSPQRYL